MIITIATSKGGSGKTTIATNLAATAAYYRHATALIDADDTPITLKWLQLRDRSGSLHPISGHHLTAEKSFVEQVQALDEANEMVIIDPGGWDHKTFRLAVGMSDLVIIPARASLGDLTHVNNIVALISRFQKQQDGYPRARILINQVRRVGSIETFREMLGEYRNIAPVMVGSIGLREDFVLSSFSGKGVLEIAPGAEAAQEIHNIWMEIKKIMEV